jgi:outer membrane immunogenic protein
MKRALVGLIAATALVSPAVAADLPLPVEPIVAPIPVFSWTGFYAGANVGWGCCSEQDVGLFDHDDVDGDGDIFEGDIASLDDDGVFAGVQAGYNFQWNWLVTGVEADWQWSGIFDDESGTTSTGPADGFRGHASSDVDWFATLRGRAGFAWQRFFIYGTGGLAAGNVEYTVRLRGVGPDIRHDEEWEWGWVAGAGAEFAFTDNLSAKAEWQFIDLGTEDASSPDGRFSTHPTIEFHTFRVGLNYRFNGLFQ